MKKNLLAITLGGFLLAVLGCWYLIGERDRSEGVPLPPSGSDRAPAPSLGQKDPGVTATAGAEVESAESPEGLAEANPTAKGYSDWRAVLAALPAAERATVYETFLAGGADGPTGEGFRVGPGGSLREAPTWRVAALDGLGAADPARAAAVARAILENSSSPDEWAVALRNYGRTLAEPGTDDFFNDRIDALLGNHAWRAEPTGGFLEAFDAAVYSGHPRWAGALLEIHREAANPAVRRASAVGFEGLAAHQPLAVSQALAEARGPDGAWDLLEVSALARLDPRVEAEREALWNGISSLPMEGEATDYFFTLFPNANLFVGDFLLTRAPQKSLREQAALDAAALSAVRAWQSEVADPNLRGRLGALADYLAAHVEAARAHGFLPPSSSE